MIVPNIFPLHFHRHYQIFIIVSSILFLFSCKKDDDKIVFDSKLAESEIAMFMAFDDVDYITFEGMELSNNIMEGKLLHDEGPLGVACVSYSFSIQQNTTTIDFGDGCEGPDKKIRKGKIIISQTGKYFEPGTIVTTALDNYTVNDVLLEGTVVVTNISPERTNTPNFSLRVENGKAIWPDQTFATRDILLTRSWKRSEHYNDMEYNISGNTSGVTRNGMEYTSQIKNNLWYKWACLEVHQFFPVEGKISLTLENEDVYAIDYGNGTCDNKISISLKENTKEVALY